MASSSAATNELSATNTNLEDVSKVHLKIMSPSPGVPSDLAYHVEPTTTINALKSMITESLESSPPGEQQKLIYRGKILEGASTIDDALTGNYQEVYTLHLVISPLATATIPFSASSSQPPPVANPTTAAFRPEFARFATSVGTNPASRQPGGFTTTTVHTTTSIITPRGPRSPFNALNTGGSSSAGSSDAYSRGEATLERLQQELRTQRETLDRLRRAHRATVDMATNTSTRFGSSSGVSLPGLETNTTVRSRTTSPFGATASGTTNPFPLSSPLAGQPPTGTTPSIPPSSAFPPPNLPTPEQTVSQNLEYIEALRRGQNAAASLPSFPRHDEEAARRRALRDSLREMEQEEAGLFPGDPGQPLPTTTPLAAQPLTFTQQIIPENSLVYLLQDQFGRPHSLLVGPPGSALLNPSIYSSGLQYPRLNNGYNPMGFGLPLYPPIPPMPQMNPGTRLGPQPPAPPNIAPAVPAGQQQPDMEALRRELLAMNPNAQFRQINIPRLMRDRAGHLWLALKLAVFVVLFTGNGGWQRMLSLGFIAVLIFVWQTGLLNQITRPLIEAFYPPPPPGFQRPVVPQAQQQPINPAQTAQMLVNRQEDRLREVIRNVERAFMIFMASLVPGWHDRHVNAIERQQQQAREVAQQQQQQQQQAEEDQPQPAEARGAEVVEGVL